MVTQFMCKALLWLIGGNNDLFNKRGWVSWTVDIKSKIKTANLSERNIGKYLNDLGTGKEFFNKTEKALTLKGIINCILSK